MKAKLPIGDHLTAVKAAALLDLSPRTLKDHVKRGDLRGYRIGSQVIIEGDSLRAFLRAREISPAN